MTFRRIRKCLLDLFPATFCMLSLVFMPSYAQATIRRGSCNSNEIVFVDVCLPNYSKMPLSVALGDQDGDGISESQLPGEAVQIIYRYVFGSGRPAATGPLNVVLPIVLLSHDDRAGTPYLNHRGLRATIGEIVGPYTSDPNFTAYDIPAFRDYLVANNPHNITPVSQYQFIREAYLNSGTTFGRTMLLGRNRPNREEIIRRIGQEDYDLLGLDRMTLAEVAGFLDQIQAYNGQVPGITIPAGSQPGGDFANEPRVRAALKFFKLMAEPVTREYLKNSISESPDGLGLVNVAANNFSHMVNATFGDIFGGAFVPLERVINLNQTSGLPIPIPVRLANLDVGATGRAPGRYLNDFLFGFSCFAIGKEAEAEVVKTEEAVQINRGKANMARLLPFDISSDFFVRVEGYPIRCHDPGATGILGALSQWKGYHVIPVMKISTRASTIYFQLGTVLTLNSLSYEPRIKLCIHVPPLGCTGAGVLAGGFRLPTINLGQVGIIFVAPEAIAQLMTPVSDNRSENFTITMLAYMLKFTGIDTLGETLQRVNGGLQLLQYLPEAQRRLENGQVMDIMPRPGTITTVGGNH